MGLLNLRSRSKSQQVSNKSSLFLLQHLIEHACLALPIYIQGCRILGLGSGYKGQCPAASCFMQCNRSIHKGVKEGGLPITPKTPQPISPKNSSCVSTQRGWSNTSTVWLKKVLQKKPLSVLQYTKIVFPPGCNNNGDGGLSAGPGLANLELLLLGLPAHARYLVGAL